MSALIYRQHLYNYNNMKLLQMLFRDEGSFLDIGANLMTGLEPKTVCIYRIVTGTP